MTSPASNPLTQRIAERFRTLPLDQRRAVYDKIRAQGLSISQFPILPRDGDEASGDITAQPSYAQVRQWFLWQLDPASTAYHIAGGLSLQGILDVSALRSSFQSLVDRHEALRTVFKADAQGDVCQVIWPKSALSIPLIDLSEMPLNEQNKQLEQHARQVHQTPFDLTQGPLMRVCLMRLSAQSHVLIVVLHHIVSDGWSMQLIVDEFVTAYRAALQGEAATSLPWLPIQYADYAAWQRSWLEAGERDRQLQYWQAQLGDEHPVLSLPTDHPRQVLAAYHAAHHSVDLPMDLAWRLQQRMKAQGATLFMGLLACWQALLYRYTGQQDIRVGVPIANRHRVETERLVGFFVNTQVLRNRLHARMLLSTVLDQARDATVAAQAHQDLPFEQLVEALQPERSLSHAPLVQVMLNHQRHRQGALHQLPGLTLTDHDLSEQAAQFELTLNTSDDEHGRVQITLSYARELFEAQTIERMSQHYQAMLKALAEAPSQAVGDVPLLSDGELGQLRQWGVNERWASHTDPMHVLIERQAAAQPDAVALILGDARLSHGQLNERANVLAHQLIAMGIGPESKVGVLLDRSLELVVALLAVMKAGGAYVPLDPQYPQDRLAWMIEDSAMGLLITESSVSLRLAGLPLPRALLLDQVDVGDVAAVCVTRSAASSGNAARITNPAVALHKDSLAYVIYTSGSTGRPKGVGVAHGPLSMHCQETATIYEMGPHSRELHFLSFSFDGAHERWLTALGCGASLVLRDRELWTAAQTHEAMTRHEVSHAGFPPAYLQQLADWARPVDEQGIAKNQSDQSDQSDQRKQPASVRLYSFGGEAMPREGFDAVRTHLKPEILINGYGPTEAVVTPLVWKVGANESFEQAYAPIGRPVGDRKALVLDADMNLVPPGVAGELYLGGQGLARGYLDRGALTAERFVPDPFDDQGARLYRTGDLVRWRADGQVEYVGRLDQQVKIRGFRIELGEVEAQLLAQEGIKEAVVVAQASPGGARLVAYVVARGELPTHTEAQTQTLDTAHLKAKLSRTLPDYMVPSIIMQLPHLPINANGKVDRKALPEPPAQQGEHFDPPQGEVEQALARIWAQVLKLPEPHAGQGQQHIGRHSNFFELGGHSLLALQMLVRIHDRFGADSLALSSVFGAPTLSALAQVIQQKQKQQQRKRNHSQDKHENTHPDLPHEIETIDLASPRDQGVPLYCLPGLLVNSTEYKALVESLAGTRHVCGFVSHALTSRRWRGASVQQLAADYADHIRRTVKGRHCALLGWSFGGDIAFEAARQLAGQIDVVFMGLIDVTCEQALAPARQVTDASRLEAQQVKQAWLAQSRMQAHWQDLFARLNHEQQDAIDEYILLRQHPLPLDGPGFDSQEFREWALLDMKLVRSAYQHGQLDVPVHVWLAEQSMRDEVLRDWAPHAPVAAQHVVAGANHMDIVRAPGFAQAVAQTLSGIDAMLRAQDKAGDKRAA